MIRVEHQDVRNNCCLVFTSGTSGYAPKAAILSHSNLVAAIDSKLYDQNGPQYNSEDIYLHCAPLYHVGGLISGLAAIKADAKHIFLESFDARSFLHAIVTAEVTAFIAVPTMLRKIQRICKDTHMTPRPTTVSSAVQSNGPRTGCDHSLRSPYHYHKLCMNSSYNSGEDACGVHAQACDPVAP